MENSDKQEKELMNETKLEQPETVSTEKAADENVKKNEDKRKSFFGKKEKNVKQNKKNKQQNLDNLSEDELYAHIQTEKLLQKKKRQKLFGIIGLGAAFALAFVVILLAVVPVGLMPSCLEQNDLMLVTLYGKTNSSHMTLEVNREEDKARVDAFNKYYGQSFSLPYLSALFSGSLVDYEINEPHTELTGDPSSLLRGNSYAGTDNYLVKLHFKDSHILTNRNGSKYESKFHSALWESEYLSFNDVFFVVNKEEGLKDTSIYVVAEYPKFSDREFVGTINCLVTTTVKADTSKLYNAWSEFAR